MLILCNHFKYFHDEHTFATFYNRIYTFFRFRNRNSRLGHGHLGGTKQRSYTSFVDVDRDNSIYHV